MKKTLLIALCAVCSFSFVSCMDQNGDQNNDQKHIPTLSEQVKKNRTDAIELLREIEEKKYAGFIKLIQNDKCMDSFIKILANCDLKNWHIAPKLAIEDKVSQLNGAYSSVADILFGQYRGKFFTNILESVFDNAAVFGRIFHSNIVSLSHYGMNSEFNAFAQILQYFGGYDLTNISNIKYKDLANFRKSCWAMNVLKESNTIIAPLSDILFDDQNHKNLSKYEIDNMSEDGDFDGQYKNINELNEELDDLCIRYLEIGGIYYLHKFLTMDVERSDSSEFKELKKFIKKLASTNEGVSFLSKFTRKTEYVGNCYVLNFFGNYIIEKNQNRELLKVVAMSWLFYANSWINAEHLEKLLNPFEFLGIARHISYNKIYDNIDRYEFSYVPGLKPFNIDRSLVNLQTQNSIITLQDEDKLRADIYDEDKEQSAVDMINCIACEALDMDEQFQPLVKQKKDTENFLFMWCLQMEGLDKLLGFLRTEYPSLAIKVVDGRVPSRLMKILSENPDAFGDFFYQALACSENLTPIFNYCDKRGENILSKACINALNKKYANKSVIDIDSSKINEPIQAQKCNNFYGLFDSQVYPNVLQRFFLIKENESFGGVDNVSKIFDDFLVKAIINHSIVLASCAKTILNSEYSLYAVLDYALENKELLNKLVVGIIDNKHFLACHEKILHKDLNSESSVDDSSESENFTDSAQ